MQPGQDQTSNSPHHSGSHGDKDLFACSLGLHPFAKTGILFPGGTPIVDLSIQSNTGNPGTGLGPPEEIGKHSTPSPLAHGPQPCVHCTRHDLLPLHPKASLPPPHGVSWLFPPNISGSGQVSGALCASAHSGLRESSTTGVGPCSQLLTLLPSASTPPPSPFSWLWSLSRPPPELLACCPGPTEPAPAGSPSI